MANLIAALGIVECVHRSGGGRTARCGAGVDVEALRDDEGRLPCLVIRGRTGAIGCDELELPAPTPASTLGPMMAALRQLDEGCCWKCGEKIESLEDGDVVVARPCGHELRRHARGERVRHGQPPRSRVRSVAGAQDRWERDNDGDDS